MNKITLTFEGNVPAKKGNKAIWVMRKSFSDQIEKLWGQEPFSFLKEWEESNFASGAPKFSRQVNKTTFLPLASDAIKVGVELDIELLTGVPPKMHGNIHGDIDNRAKRIVDSLRAVPNGAVHEMYDDAPSRVYSLMDDDRDLLAMTVRSGSFLRSDSRSQTLAMIRVKFVSLRASLSTLSMTT